jgi:hypothetical protein
MKRSLNLLLLALLIICALSLWWGRESIPWVSRRSSSASLMPKSTDVTPVTSAALRPAELVADEVIHVVVLNGTARTGLAREASLALSVSGCVTERLGNAPHAHYPLSLLVNRRLSPKVADAFAARLGGIPVVQEKDSRTTEDAVLVLGADYAGIFRALGLEPPR